MDRTCFPLRGIRALRRGRRSEAGRCYLVTFATRGREPVFANADVAMVAARALAQQRLWRASMLRCWVLMPDHWHGLVELSACEGLSTLIGRVKAVSARAVGLAANRRIDLWSAGFHDRAVRREEDLIVIARYIVRNPVRAGLCERVGDYPYRDAAWL